MRTRTPVVAGLEAQTSQVAALAADQRIDRLDLNPLQAGVATLDISEVITAAMSTLTMEGASSLDITLEDPAYLIEQSGVTQDRSGSRRLASVDIKLDAITYRLAKASRQGTELTLTFEDLIVSLLRQHTKPMSASRGSMTRAQFIERMLREVRYIQIPFYSPEKGRRQVAEQPNYPDTAPARGETGFDTGASFKIKGVRADAEQKRQLATALGIADDLNAKPRARVAMVAAGIGESDWRAIPNSQGSPYGGVLQGKIRADSQGAKQFDLGDTQGMATSFLKGGKGFQGGGAIKLARDHPDWSAGRIALEVEGSVSNFSSPAAGEAYYQAGHDEAVKIVDLWKSGDQTGGASDTQTEVRQYQFRRGQPGGKHESSWDAALRLAQEVNWRFYAVGGVAVFASDDALLLNPAAVKVEGPRDDGVLGFDYDVDHGKVAQQVVVHVDANRWAVSPGEVVVLDGLAFGDAEGAWLVHTFEQDLFDLASSTLTLTKPMPPGKEPAPDVNTVTKSSSSSSSSASDGKVLDQTYTGSPVPGLQAHTATHETAGLPGYPAYDYMAKSGSPCVSPVNGRVWKLSGHDPKLGPPQGPGGPLGWSVYIRASNGDDYFLTHMGTRTVAVGDRVKQGEQIGTVADYHDYGRPDHIHMGVHRA